jgi:iron complex transport system substrate-binding protein
LSGSRPRAGRELHIRIAENFAIEYLADQVKLLTDSDGNEMLLVPRGQEVPAGYAGRKVIRTPVTHALFTATPPVGYVRALSEALGDDSLLFDAVGAVTTPAEDWAIPQGLLHEQCRGG